MMKKTVRSEFNEEWEYLKCLIGKYSAKKHLGTKINNNFLIVGDVI